MTLPVYHSNPESDNTPNCPACDLPMHFEGEQRYDELGYSYQLYTCLTDGCARNGFTSSHNRRDIVKPPAAHYAVLADAILTYQAHRAACDSMDWQAAALGNVLANEAETINVKLAE